MKLQFLQFVVDREAEELRCAGQVIAVERKVLAFIHHLADRAGDTIERAELLALIWPDTKTTDSSLMRVVSLARDVLEVSSSGDALPVIETIRGRGYRLNPDIRVVRSEDPLAGEQVAPPSIFDQLDSMRATFFVGREAELAQLDRLLDPIPVGWFAYVHGPGGVGKSELLGAFRRSCIRREKRCAWVDCARLDSFDDSLRLPFREADIIFLDAAEKLGGLHPVLFRDLLGDLDDRQRVVIASRTPPNAAWFADPALAQKMVEIGLGNLDEARCARVLTARGVPGVRQSEVYRETYGHPLAVGLAAEVLLQNPTAQFELQANPDLVQSLLSQLLEEMPSGDQRTALWCAALCRALPEELLAAMLDRPDVQTQFEWLRNLSFVRNLREGLVPHDLASATLFADLCWRAQGTRRTLARRAINYFCDRAEREPARAHELTLDLGYLYRVEESQSPEGREEFYVTTPAEGDWDAIESWVQSFEGDDAMSHLRAWRDGPVEVDLLRDSRGDAAAFQLGIWMDRVEEAQALADPGVAPLYRMLERMGTLSGNENRIYYSRFWMSRETYHGAGPAAHAMMDVIWGKTLRYDLDLGFFCHAAPEGYLKKSRGSVEHWPDCDFEMGTRPLGVLGHDYREERIVDWVRRAHLKVFG